MKDRVQDIKKHCLTVICSPILWVSLMIVFIASFSLLFDAVKCLTLWKYMVTLPEPERCALCADRGYIDTYPCLINLHTGQVGQLRVNHAQIGKWLNQNSPDTVHSYFFFSASLPVTNTTDAQHSTSMVTLPKEALYISPNLYCHDCRAKIAEAIEVERIFLNGYILADLHDLENIRLYPISDGAKYQINGCTVEVSKGKRSEGLTICVTIEY